jgi:hypothetical protein
MMLVATNVPTLITSALHLVVFRRVLPCVIFFLLGIASTVFHVEVDLKLSNGPLARGSSFCDRLFAYCGMAYHFSRVFQSFTLWSFASSAVCFISLYFYFTGAKLYDNGDFPGYVRWHSMWHISASLGTFMFLFV